MALIVPGNPLIGTLFTDGTSIIGDGTSANPIQAIGAAPTGAAVLDSLRWNSEGGPVAFALGDTQNDFTPTNWSTRTFFMLSAADNEGTRITGFGALPDRTVRVLYNSGTRVDDGNLILQPQNGASQTANRIFCPQDQDLKVAAHGCVVIMYSVTIGGWIVLAVASSRHRYTCTEWLGLYPDATCAAITGTINDWAPTVTKLQNSAFTGIGSAGGALTWKDNSLFRLLTNDTTGAIVTGLSWITEGLGSNAEPANHGPIKVFCNYGPGPVTWKYNSSNSAVGNRLFTPGSVDLVQNVNDVVTFVSVESTGWFVLANSQRTDGNFTAKKVIAARLAVGSAAGDYYTPSAIANAQVDNLFAGDASFLAAGRIRLQGGGGSCQITGMAGANDGVITGEEKTFQNFGSQMILVYNSASSNADRRFVLPSAVNMTVPAFGCFTLVYDQNQQWWLKNKSW